MRFTRQDKEAIELALKAGVQMKDIAKQYGVTTYHLRYHIDPDYRDLVKRRAKENKMRLQNKLQTNV